METRKFNTNEKDNNFANFARALALPVRVLILRRIVENGFTIDRNDLYKADFARETINKHLSELRSLGALKIEGNKDHITYNIDQNWFTQMVTEFLTFFGKNIFPPQSEIVNRYVKKDSSPVIREGQSMQTHPHFGAFIKKYREELHITQENFAKKIRIDRAQLSRIECGKKPINLNKLKAVSKALYLDYQEVKREYYSYQLAEIIDESGYDESVLFSAREKLGQLSQRDR